MSPERYMDEHSVIPYYRIFFQKEVYESIKPEMVVGRLPYARQTLKNQGKIIAEESGELWYCPICHSFKEGLFRYSDLPPST